MGDTHNLATRFGSVWLVMLLLVALAPVAAVAQTDSESNTAYPLTFPVSGDNSWTDTWGAPRSEGRTHEGTDIFAAKGTPVVAAADGTITRIAIGERAGRYIVITHPDGWSTYYMHLNNDTPGTDDGLQDALLDGIYVGARVNAGEVIDFVGDSGNAETTPAHLHFELHQPDGTPINPAPHLQAAVTGDPIIAAQVTSITAAAKPAYTTDGTELVGHIDPETGFAAGLFVYNDVAYMGTWGRQTACPASGVRVIDVTDPTEPSLLTALATGDDFPETSTDSIWVTSVDNEYFAGDVAVVSVRLCDTSERNRRRDSFRGLALYDVTDPAKPTLLAEVDSGQYTQGVNDITGTTRSDGQVIVSATVMQSYLHTEGELGDWRLLDITNPFEPQLIADWDYRLDRETGDLDRDAVDVHIHTSTLAADGQSVWLAAWDGGLVQLDITGDPTVVAAIPLDDGDPGNAHSIAVDESTGLLIRTDENLEWRTDEGDLVPFGAQTVYDLAQADKIVAVGSYATERSDLTGGQPAAPGYFSAHEIVLEDNLEYVSWYSDGLRVLDLADPRMPVEVASFVPAPTADPQRHFLGQGRGEAFAMVWGVKVVDDLIYLSDMNSGLWIVQLEQPEEVALGAL